MSSPLPSKLPASARKFRDVSAGLFVGVSEFADSSLTTVPYAVDDAVDLAHLFVFELELIDPKKVVLLLAGQPQKLESQKRLDELLAAAVPKAPPSVASIYDHCYRLGQATETSGLFVVSLATHGLLDQGKGVLAVADSLKRRPVHTGLVLDVLLEELSQSRAEKRLALVDACRDRFEGKTRGDDGIPFGDAFVSAMEKARGCATLAAASRGGYAYDDLVRRNGVFTAAVIDGLRGGAEGDSHAIVTLESVAAFAQQQVRDWVLKNRPDHKDLSLGITPTYDPESMRHLPLAINAKARLAEFERSSGKAVRHLLSLVSLRDPLVVEIQRILQVEEPHPVHFELIEEVEAFDGSERLRRSLRAFLDEKRDSWSSSIAPPVILRAEPAIEDPFWAAAKGRDEFGQWADLRVESVVACSDLSSR